MTEENRRKNPLLKVADGYRQRDEDNKAFLMDNLEDITKEDVDALTRREVNETASKIRNKQRGDATKVSMAKNINKSREQRKEVQQKREKVEQKKREREAERRKVNRFLHN